MEAYGGLSTRPMAAIGLLNRWNLVDFDVTTSQKATDDGCDGGGNIYGGCRSKSGGCTVEIGGGISQNVDRSMQFVVFMGGTM